jgi:predicted methyltransferase
VVITKKEFNYILEHKEDSVFTLKVDFGLKEARVKIDGNKAIFEDGATLDLKESIKEKFCYYVDSQGVKKIAFFSYDTNKFYKLTPTADWPTVCIGSVPMHKLNSPRKDTQGKISLLKPCGITLDTCMGLGYSAILAAKTAKLVITFEKDENVFFLAKINPFSQSLFSSLNIKTRREDVTSGIKKFKNEYFDCIIHDPPTFKLSVPLYSYSFYQELKRVLKKGGRLFHYAPLYKVRQGFDFPSQIKTKLKDTGFRIVYF